MHIHKMFYIKTFKIAPTCFDPKIIFRELHCSLLKSQSHATQHTTHTHSQAHSQHRTTYTIRHAATAPCLYMEINQ